MKTIIQFSKPFFVLSFLMLPFVFINSSSAQCTDPVVTPIADQNYNDGDVVPSIQLFSNIAGATFSWSSAAPAIGLFPMSGTGDIPSFTASNFSCTESLSSTFTVYAYDGACQSQPVTFTITVHYRLAPSIDPVIIANPFNVGDVVPAIQFTSNIAGAQFTWSRTVAGIGLSAMSGTGDVPSFTAENSSCTDPLSSTFTVYAYNGACQSFPVQFVITINHHHVPFIYSPTVTSPFNVGDVEPTISFTADEPGVTFSWNRTNNPIGLSATSGTGDIPSFTAANASCASAVSSEFTVTGFDGTCLNTSLPFLITVEPVVIDPVANESYNVGDVIPLHHFTSNVPGAELIWFTNATSGVIGLVPTSGHGDMPSFTATTTSCSDPVTVTFYISPFGCVGQAPVQFTITVHPAVIDPVTNENYNVGDVIPLHHFTSNIPGTNILWFTNANSGAIGLVPTSGHGDMPSFTAVNTSCTDAITVTFYLTPYGCVGQAPVQFTITVNPLVLEVDAIANQNYNPGDAVPSVVFGSNMPGSTFTWSRTSEAIGLAATSGNATYIPSFTATNSFCNPLTSTFTVQAHNGTCISPPLQFTMTVNAIPPPNVDAGPNKIVYKGYPDSSCTKLQSTSSGGVPPRTLTWSNGSHASFINVCPTTTTVYTVTVTDSRGCTAKDSVKVCAVDVRCGSGLTNVTICHGTGSATNPFVTICLDKPGAKYHFIHHTGDQLGSCGMIKSCIFPVGRLDESSEEIINGNDVYLGAFPNPFASTTTIRFMLPENDFATVKVMDVAGREIEKLFDGGTEAGNIYDATFDGAQFSNGIYFLVMQTRSGIVQSRKLILDK